MNAVDKIELQGLATKYEAGSEKDSAQGAWEPPSMFFD